MMVELHIMDLLLVRQWANT